MSTTEAEKLAQTIEDDYYALVHIQGHADGFTTVDVLSHGSGRWNEHMQIITQGPSGKFYSWTYESGLTEMQDDNFDYLDITEVLRTEVPTVVVQWVAA